MRIYDNKNKLARTALSVVGALGFVSVLSVGMYNATNIANTSNASALSYSTSEDISFTFKPTLSIGLSTDSLTIDNLAPGTTSDSNSVTVTVSSNTPYGYVLSAGVGSNDTTSPYYNTSSLTHENTTISNVFRSVDANASLSSLDTDNTWGYSTSTDNGTTWSTYSGLSHTTTKPLLDISDPATPSTIDFKIAARSATTQASGTYNNVITFYAVGKPEPPTYMQETHVIETKLKNAHDTMTAIDQRDDREYTIAKLKDGRIWMTQNLDLAGGTALYSETSDVPYGYSSSDNRPYYTLPASSESGFKDYYREYMYNVPFENTDRTICADDHPCYSYYSWRVATALSSLSTIAIDAPYSICPKGWKLPTSRSRPSTASDFYNLIVAYGGPVDNTLWSPSYFLDQAGPNTTPNFQLAGNYSSAFSYGGTAGTYWSSSKYDGISAYDLAFTSQYSETGATSGAQAGKPVRCILAH